MRFLSIAEIMNVQLFFHKVKKNYQIDTYQIVQFLSVRIDKEVNINIDILIELLKKLIV